jgi:hypothetical protein
MSDPWQRLEEETDPAWEAFRCYRDLGLERSIAKVAGELDKSVPLMERWSSKHRWVMRSTTFDIEQDRLWVASLNTERRKMAERQVKTAALAQNKVAQWLIDLNPDALTAGEAARWLEVASKMEQAVLGLPHRIEVSGPNDGPVEIAALTPEETVSRLRQVQTEIKELLDE